MPLAGQPPLQVVQLITVTAPETDITDTLCGANLHVQSSRRCRSSAGNSDGASGYVTDAAGSAVDANNFDLAKVGPAPGLEREYAEEQRDIATKALDDRDAGTSSPDAAAEDDDEDVYEAASDETGIDVESDSDSEEVCERFARQETTRVKFDLQPITKELPIEEEDDEDDEGATIAAGTKLDDSCAEPQSQPQQSQPQQLQSQQSQQKQPKKLHRKVSEEELTTEIDRAVHRSMLKSIRDTTVLSSHSKKKTMLSVSRPVHSLFTFDPDHLDSDLEDLEDLLNFEI